VDERTQQAILRNAKSHFFEPYKAVAEHVDGVTGCQVQHVLHHAGYHHQVAQRNPFLMKIAVKKWLKWAKDNTGKGWGVLVWTGESSIET